MYTKLGFLALICSSAAFANSYYMNDIDVKGTHGNTGYVTAYYRGGAIENLSPGSGKKFGPPSYFQLTDGFIINSNGGKISLPDTCKTIVLNEQTLHFIGKINPDGTYNLKCELLG